MPPVPLLAPAQAHVLKAAYFPSQTPAKPAFHVLKPNEQAKLPKKDRVAYRKSLIAAGRDQAGTMPPGKEHDALLAQCSQFEADNKAVENARLSAAVYSPANAPGGAGQVEGWDRVDPSTLKGQLNDPSRWSPKSGMKAALFRSQIDGNYVIAYKGTDSTNDAMEDLRQAAGSPSDEYKDALALAKTAKSDQDIGSSLSLTGHSLGGGQAATAGIVMSIPTETFNAAGVNQATLTPYNASLSTANQYVENYQEPGDVLSRLQGSTMDSFLRSMAVGGLQGSSPELAQQWMDPKTKFMYPAAGRQVMVPVPNRTFTSTTADGFPIEVTEPADMFDKHKIGTVIEGFEIRKSQNSSAITKAVQ